MDTYPYLILWWKAMIKLRGHGILLKDVLHRVVNNEIFRFLRLRWTRTTEQRTCNTNTPIYEHEHTFLHRRSHSGIANEVLRFYGCPKIYAFMFHIFGFLFIFLIHFIQFHAIPYHRHIEILSFLFRLLLLLFICWKIKCNWMVWRVDQVWIMKRNNLYNTRWIVSTVWALFLDACFGFLFLVHLYILVWSPIVFFYLIESH